MPGTARDIPPSATSNAIELSIVIPTFNGWNLLQRCLQSVLRHAPAGAEIIVVDDGSTDGTCEHVGREFPGVLLFRLNRNGGFCKAANAGIAAARGEIVELLNNDTEVTSGWTSAAVARFEDPTIGSVAPLVRQLPKRIRIDSAGDILTAYGVAKKRGEGASWMDRRWSRPTEVLSASASSAFYRRSAVIEVGGFPERFGAYLDDVDLGLRLRSAGYRCLYEPGSTVFHWVSQSHRVGSRRMLQQVSANSERMFWSNASSGQLAWQALPHFAYVLALIGYKALKGEFAPWFAGKCQTMADVAWILRRRMQVISSK